ncbi:MAG: hydroxyacylglutathione hydrolase [Hydrocarboniphaga sp.]|uniref:hydroxyacylglutathione hydrolase n=1 Tax=Hydrocarboniphaga sp. TaxID=2033016 RepID=UPI0026268A27|nr:hydroxyacylglutathione hydrolase [Hydrocarboniphaga sp.]MDB5973131.1 hydroxyacylglutathione hydrolase [Hydrocarboniphaga sp.]
MSKPIRSESPAGSGLQVRAIPTFSDNYVWLLQRGMRAVLVDPGESGPVQRVLDQLGLTLEAILVTHHHSDHVGGIEALVDGRAIPVPGPKAEASKIPTLTRHLVDGDEVRVLDTRAQVIAIPGHTLGHIAFYFAQEGLLFCGDTLFSGGCGRLFEGTPAQMLASLERLAALPEDTAVYCAHEYTQSNLAFAQTVDKGNRELADYRIQIDARRAAQMPSLPSSIGVERAINPFLRTGLASVRNAVTAQAGAALVDQTAVFAALRAWKDDFRPPAVA